MLVHWKMTSVLSRYRHIRLSCLALLNLLFHFISSYSPSSIYLDRRKFWMKFGISSLSPCTQCTQDSEKFWSSPKCFGWNSQFLRRRRVLCVHKAEENCEVRRKCSLERRWSSRTFRYGYLVTTSPQSSTPPSTAAPIRLAHRLRVLSTLMVWRAVCTRPGNVFTAACWSAITSNSNFMQASFSLQSELRPSFVIRSISRFCCTLLLAIVVRVRPRS